MVKQEDITLIIPHFGEDERACYALGETNKSLLETFACPQNIFIVKNGINGCKCSYDMNMLAQGQCKAVNAAVATTNTEWIMVSNSDMIYPPNWFENLVKPGIFIPDNVQIGQNIEVKCVSPKLIEPRDGAPTFEKYFCGGAGGDFDKQKWLEFAKDHKGIGLRTGFNLPFLIKRELWDLIGGYDINYDPWGSNGDSDLEYKIRLAGVQPYQNTNCVVYHFSNTSGTFEPRNRGFWGQNFAYFEKKWGFKRTDDRIWEADFVMPDKERIFRPWWEGYFNDREVHN